MYRKIKYFFIFYIFSILLLNTLKLNSQTYGLEFSGINQSLDQRTELDLSRKGYLTFKNEFEISFDYKANRHNPNSNRGLFGYVLRIINKDGKNVDLISSFSSQYVIDNARENFSLVIGSRDSIVKVNYPKNAIDDWVRLKIKIDLKKDQLIFYLPDSFYVQEKIGFKEIDDVKMFFGANDYRQFKTSDVPTMSIRDIKISEQGKLKYHWPLDEKENDIATDILSGSKAHIKNPIWLNLNHQIWKQRFENKFVGKIMFASNESKGEIYMVGEKELTIFYAADNSTKKVVYKNEVKFFNKDYRAIYNSLEDKIYCYLVDGDTYFILNIEKGIWSEVNSTVKTVTTFFEHHNRYFSPSDNSIYLFGGYGRRIYNNEIRKIDIESKSYIDIPTNDSIYQPRYLAGLGALNDTIYILGGYGSKSGNQLINPQSYYDLIGFSIQDKTLFKKFEIPHVIDDMCVVNSMWIDEATRDYYALIFEKNKFDGYLRLIKGNLDVPDVDFVGAKLPFHFLDISSNAGLKYMPNQNKLYAFTSYVTDSINTQTNIHSINYPPNKFIETPNEVKESEDYSMLYIIFTGIIVVLGFCFWYYKRRKTDQVVTAIIGKEKEIIKTPFIVKEDDKILNKTDDQLIFFGGFQVIDKEAKDITSHFTPLLKELFLLIWLHTFKNNKGISTEKITEILWYDKSDKSAQNNRSVNLAKLRGLLKEMGDFEISKKTGYWKTIFDESKIKSDYVEFLNLTSSRESLTKQKIYQLIDITKKGPFLRNVQYPWLDYFKAKVSNNAIDSFIHFAYLCDINKEADFIIHLADSIFIFDDTNEDAMILKCKAYYQMGKHSYAKETYEKFFDTYFEMYGEKYEQTFVNILKSED